MTNISSNSQDAYFLPPSSLIIEALASVQHDDFHSLAAVFRSEHEKNNSFDWATLAQVMEFHFRSENAAEPFGPLAVFDDKRTMVPDDLTEAQLNCFSCYVDETIDDLVVARCGDVLWLRRRDVAAARKAVDAYLGAGIKCEDPDNWVASFELYERGVRLARQIEPKGQLTRRLLTHLEERVFHYSRNYPTYFLLKAINLLEEFRFGQHQALADLAGRIANISAASGDLEGAQEYYMAQSRLLRRVGKPDAAEAALCLRAEAFVQEAEAQETAGSFIGAHHFWQEAVRSFQNRPSLRARLPELRLRLAEAGKRLLGEMKTIRSEPIALTEQIESVQLAFRGLALDDAIFRLALVTPLIEPANLRKETLDDLKGHPLQTVFKTEIFDHTGRKMATRPPMGSGDQKADDAALEAFMDQKANFDRHLTVHAILAPAIQVIRDEHNFDQNQLARFVSESRFVPRDRVNLVTRGLEAGFSFDFATALHLLVPQTENGLRYILESEGIIARNISDDGVEDVWSLEKTLDHPKMVEILSESFKYNLRNLLAGRLGPNLRNLIAHGLVGEKQLNSHTGLYLWWVLFRLIVISSPQLAAFAERQRKGGD